MPADNSTAPLMMKSNTSTPQLAERNSMTHHTSNLKDQQLAVTGLLLRATKIGQWRVVTTKQNNTLTTSMNRTGHLILKTTPMSTPDLWTLKTLWILIRDLWMEVGLQQASHQRTKANGTNRDKTTVNIEQISQVRQIGDSSRTTQRLGGGTRKGSIGDSNSRVTETCSATRTFWWLSFHSCGNSTKIAFKWFADSWKDWAAKNDVCIDLSSYFSDMVANNKTIICQSSNKADSNSSELPPVHSTSTLASR